jgi:hypothetical protein
MNTFNNFLNPSYLILANSFICSKLIDILPPSTVLMKESSFLVSKFYLGSAFEPSIYYFKIYASYYLFSVTCYQFSNSSYYYSFYYSRFSLISVYPTSFKSKVSLTPFQKLNDSSLK